VSEQTRTARCARRGRPGLPPGSLAAVGLTLEFERCNRSWSGPRHSNGGGRGLAEAATRSGFRSTFAHRVAAAPHTRVLRHETSRGRRRHVGEEEGKRQSPAVSTPPRTVPGSQHSGQGGMCRARLPLSLWRPVNRRCCSLSR